MLLGCALRVAREADMHTRMQRAMAMAKHALVRTNGAEDQYDDHRCSDPKRGAGMGQSVTCATLLKFNSQDGSCSLLKS